MKKLRGALLLLLAAAVVVAGYFLPSALMTEQKELLLSRIGMVTLEDHDDPEISRQTAIQAADIARNYAEDKDWLDYAPVQEQMDEDTAVLQAMEEIRKLCDAGALPPLFSSLDEFTHVAEHGTKKYRTKDRFAIIPTYGCWRITFSQGDTAVTVYMNSISGQVLGMEFTGIETGTRLEETFRAFISYLEWGPEYEPYQGETAFHGKLLVPAVVIGVERSSTTSGTDCIRIFVY